MGDILTPKRQTVVDRLRRRIEFYRDHQESCYPRYENTCGGFYDQQRQETQILRQRFLESKAKKSKKDHRSVKDSNLNSDGQRGLIGQQKFSKRALDTSSSTLEGTSGQNDEHEHKPKIIRTCKTPDQSSAGDKSCPKDFQNQQQQSQPQQQTSIPNFSGQMLIQQFTSINSQVQLSGKAIQTNSSNDNANKVPKSDSLSVGSMCLPSKGSDVLSNTSISPLENIVCKQEREPDLNQCNSTISSATATTVTTDVTCNTLAGSSAGNCERFSDPLSNLGFPDDSTDDMINVELNDLNDLNDFLNGVDVLSESSEFMKGFSFDDTVTSDKDDKETTSIIENECRKTTDVNQQQNFSSTSSLHSSYLGLTLSPQQSSIVFDPSLTTSAVNSAGLVSTSSSNSCFDQTQIGNFGPTNSIGLTQQNVGFDFKLKDPSPAAQTLKQLAEQHQNMQQKQQLQQHSQAHFNVDAFSNTLPSLHVSFLNNATSSLTNSNSSTLCQKNPSGDLFSTDVFKQTGFENLNQSDLFKPDAITSSFLGGNTMSGLAQQADLNVRQDIPTHMHTTRRGGRGQGSAAASKVMYNVDLDQKPCITNVSNFRASRSSPHLSEQPGVSHTTTSTTHASSALPTNNFMSATGPSLRTSSPQYQNVKQSPNVHTIHVDNHQLHMGAGKQKLQSTQGKTLDVSQALKQQSANGLPQTSVFRGFPCNPGSTSVGNFQVSASQHSITYTTQCTSSVVTTSSLLQTVSNTMDSTPQLSKHRINQQSGLNLPSQHNDDMFFLTCPPPEYKPQLPSGSQVPNASNIGNTNALLPMVLNSNQPFGIQGDRGLGGLSRTYPENAAANQSSHQLTSKPISASLTSQTHHHQQHMSSVNMSQANMNSTLPTYSEASQMNTLSSQGLGSIGQPQTATTKPLYTSALTHDQRAPPNVNIGPEGLNISQMNPMMGLDWKHSLVQQNSNPRGCAPMVSAQQKMARFGRGAQHGNFGTNVLSANNAGPRQIAPRNFVPQQATIPGTDAVNPSHLPNQLLSQTQQQHQLTSRNNANVQGQTLGMQMSTTNMSLRNGPSLLDHSMFQGNHSALGSLNTSTMQDNANISLDYLNGIDSNANLMNFDQVIQGNGAFGSLLDDMGVLGK